MTRVQSATALDRGALQQTVLIVGIAICAAAANWMLFPLHHGADFYQFHYHARVWLSGHDPYVGGVPIMRTTGLVPEPLFYPLPMLLVVVPFAGLPLRLAAAAFVGASTGILAFGIVRRSPERLPLFLGSGFFVTLILGQWSPLITASVVLPALAWLAPIKPNLGLAVVAARPTRIAVLGGAAFLAATLLIQPSWPREWLHNVHSVSGHPAPILAPGGILVLLALARWRRAEARLIVTMACVPQLMYFSDQLPLWLVPKTRRESIVLSATSNLAWASTLVFTIKAGHQPAFSSSWYVLAGIYIPVVVMVLRRPNEGPLPGWIERVVSFAPAWLRGQTAAPEVVVDTAREEQHETSRHLVERP